MDRKPLLSSEIKKKAQSINELVDTKIRKFVSIAKRDTRPTVIIIDDDNDTVEMLYKPFASKGIIVEWAQSPEAAIDYMKKFTDRDIIGIYVDIPNVTKEIFSSLKDALFDKIVYTGNCSAEVGQMLDTLNITHVSKDERSIQELVDLVSVA